MVFLKTNEIQWVILSATFTNQVISSVLKLSQFRYGGEGPVGLTSLFPFVPDWGVKERRNRKREEKDGEREVGPFLCRGDTSFCNN